MATLEEIRSKLISQQQKSENRFSGDRAMYPFWNTPEGKTSVLRFLPDGNTNNTFFWEERLVIKLPFQGIKCEHDREVLVQVPCMKMYGEACPILAEIRPWWNDKSLEALARRYWMKKSYIFQGFVVDSAFEEKDLPENSIRRFTINGSIFEIIKSSLMNPEMEDMPTDLVNGRDFKLTKTTKGGFANYGTSNWSFKTRSLAEAERNAISTHGLFTLKDFLPKKPTAEELDVIKEMFQASVNDEAYDPQRWSNHFKPLGSFNDTASSATPDVAVDDEPEVRSTPKVSSGTSDALARLQAKAAAKPVTPKVEASESTSSGTKDPLEILRKLKERRSEA
jgi:hypothetical protein